MTLLKILIAIALFTTLGVLLFGIVSMARGGDFNKKYSNKIMRLRVISQFITIILLGIFAAISLGG